MLKEFLQAEAYDMSETQIYIRKGRCWKRDK